MYYHSTRSSAELTSSQAVIQGLAKDGGLYVPSKFPDALSSKDIENFINLPYQKLAQKILSLFFDEYSQKDLTEIVNGAYSIQWDNKSIAPLTSKRAGNYYLELFHGPTLAFKDIALQCLPRLMKTALKIENNDHKIVILTATSGDTGTAAMRGFKNLDGTSVIVFYPYQGVAPIQLKQMLSESDGNTTSIAVKGNFDNAQTNVKKIFNDQDFAKELGKHNYAFSSANSMNIGRLIPQIVYYFSAYGQLVNQGNIYFGDKVNFSVPTGNFGDILAGYYAKKLGLPVGKLICASNKNNVLTDFFNTGVYNRNREFYVTNSPSMDILVSSNLERLLFDLCQDTELVKSLMTQLKETGTYELPDSLKKKLNDFEADFSTPEEIEAEIHRVYVESGYVIDPHTAVASLAAKRFKEENGDQPVVVLSTASPYKFPETVYHAISGKNVKEKGIPALSQLTDFLNSSMPKAMNDFLGKEKEETVINPNEMPNEVKTLLNI